MLMMEGKSHGNRFLLVCIAGASSTRKSAAEIFLTLCCIIGGRPLSLSARRRPLQLKLKTIEGKIEQAESDEGD